MLIEVARRRHPGRRAKRMSSLAGRHTANIGEREGCELRAPIGRARPSGTLRGVP